MNHVSLLSSMTSSEWAAWVQAVGSIAAIAISLWVARIQASDQHRIAMSTIHHERTLARTQSAENLVALAFASTNAIEFIGHALATAPAKADDAERTELKILANSLQAMGLQSLPHDLVVHALNLGSYVRQAATIMERFASKAGAHSKADLAEFNLERTRLAVSLKEVCDGIRRKVPEWRPDSDLHDGPL